MVKALSRSVFLARSEIIAGLFPAVKKGTKHRQRAPRPSSPCSTNSTNSSYGAAPRRPYPKSERKKHLQERTARTGSSSAFDQSQALAHNNNRRYHGKNQPEVLIIFDKILYFLQKLKGKQSKCGYFK